MVWCFGDVIEKASRQLHEEAEKRIHMDKQDGQDMNFKKREARMDANKRK